VTSSVGSVKDRLFRTVSLCESVSFCHLFYVDAAMKACTDWCADGLSPAPRAEGDRERDYAFYRDIKRNGASVGRTDQERFLTTCFLEGRVSP